MIHSLFFQEKKPDGAILEDKVYKNIQFIRKRE